MNKLTKLIALFSLVALAAGAASVAYADVFAYKRGTGIYKAWYDSSVASYGYTGKFDWARSKWAGVSSKVSIGYQSTNDSTTDEYYVGTSSTAGLLGLTSPYVRHWYGNSYQDPDTGNWDYCVVSLYDNNLDAAGLKTDTNIKNTATHEVGHSIGLAHTTSSGNKAASIMTAGDDAAKDRSITTPSTYDTSNVTSKWGS